MQPKVSGGHKVTVVEAICLAQAHHTLVVRATWWDPMYQISAEYLLEDQCLEEFLEGVQVPEGRLGRRQGA